MNNGTEPRLPITCPKCKTCFSAALPAPEIFNGKRVSTVTASHESPVVCIACGQGFILVAAQAQMAWGAQPVDDSILEELRGSKVIPAAIIPVSRLH